MNCVCGKEFASLDALRDHQRDYSAELDATRHGLERHIKKPWGTYPRCQHVGGGEQCSKTVYADNVCWTHYAPKKPPQPIKDRSRG